MKKIIYSFFALALTAMTMTSCEDVPAPYGIPDESGNGGETTTYEPEGDGTKDNPFNAAAVIEYASQLEPGQESDVDIYIKGKVVSIREQYSTQYGNATFYISQDGTANQQFYIYRVLYLGNKKYTDGDLLNVGDDVVICGRVTNYNGTLETQQNKAYLYSLNGNAGTTDPDVTIEGTSKGSGTQTDPFNVVAALRKIYANDGLDKEVYVKGTIASIKEIDTGNYGNATYDITDADNTNNTLTVFRGLSLGNEKFTSADEIKVGDEVVVVGKLILYQNKTPEFAQGNYIYMLNGQTERGQGSVDAGSYDNPLSVADALGAGNAEGAWVNGYIVGFVPADNLANAVFGSERAVSGNVIIADSPNETTAQKCLVVQLPRGEIRTGLNLSSNPAMLGKQVKLFGNLTAMYGGRALVNVSYAEADGNTFGTKP